MGRLLSTHFFSLFSSPRGECVRLKDSVVNAVITGNDIKNCGIHDYEFDAGEKNGEGVYIGTSSTQVIQGQPSSQEQTLLDDERSITLSRSCGSKKHYHRVSSCLDFLPHTHVLSTYACACILYIYMCCSTTSSEHRSVAVPGSKEPTAKISRSQPCHAARVHKRA